VAMDMGFATQGIRSKLGLRGPRSGWNNKAS
jgi:hypothetical protein